MEMYGLLFGFAFLALAAVVTFLVLGTVYFMTAGRSKRRNP